jgi:hypothetical protein
VSQAQQSVERSHWKSYADDRYHFKLGYPGAFGMDYTDSLLEIAYITIDPKAEPIRICAASNLRAWTSQQLFQEWKRSPPTLKFEPFPCADYPSYARLTSSAITIAGRPAYQVVSFRGPFETVCSYLATREILLAFCLPPENPSKAPGWQRHLNDYREILTSVDVTG